MPTVSVQRSVTSAEVVAALNEQLGTKYRVEPKTGNPNIIHVETSAMSTSRVHIVPAGAETKLHVHGGGLMIGRIVNEFGIAGKVAKALREANLGAAPST